MRQDSVNVSADFNNSQLLQSVVIDNNDPCQPPCLLSQEPLEQSTQEWISKLSYCFGMDEDAPENGCQKFAIKPWLRWANAELAHLAFLQRQWIKIAALWTMARMHMFAELRAIPWRVRCQRARFRQLLSYYKMELGFKLYNFERGLFKNRNYLFRNSKNILVIVMQELQKK